MHAAQRTRVWSESCHWNILELIGQNETARIRVRDALQRKPALVWVNLAVEVQQIRWFPLVPAASSSYNTPCMEFTLTPETNPYTDLECLGIVQKEKAR